MDAFEFFLSINELALGESHCLCRIHLLLGKFRLAVLAHLNDVVQLFDLPVAVAELIQQALVVLIEGSVCTLDRHEGSGSEHLDVRTELIHRGVPALHLAVDGCHPAFQ